MMSPVVAIVQITVLGESAGATPDDGIRHKLSLVKAHRGLSGWTRLRAAARPRAGLLEPTLAAVLVFLAAVPMAHERPNLLNLRGMFAQTILDELRPQLSISNEVQVKLVKHHPLVFSVEPTDSHRRRFRLSIEVGFLSTIDDEELYAALAHEMGHVWVYTHHPYLQTERLANSIGLTVARRSSFEKVYAKLWAYEHSPGVPIEELLGPEPRVGSESASPPGAD